LKIRHGAIVEDNIVTNLYAKFNDDRFWNEKALVHWKFDNNNPKNNKKNNVDGAWDRFLFPSPKNTVLCYVYGPYVYCLSLCLYSCLFVCVCVCVSVCQNRGVQTEPPK